MFKRILVPVDPARPFGAANEYACRLAQRFGATLIANYILDEELTAGAGEAVGALDTALEYVGRDAMDDFARRHPELHVEKRLSYGRTALVIFQTVLGTGADLVVVGGYKAITNPHVWGSRVVEIVNHAERSTFVVRSRADLPTPGQAIIVPFDGSKRATEALGPVAEFAVELGCSVDLVNVARRRDAEASLHTLERGRIVAEGHGADVATHSLERIWWQKKGRIILDHAHAQRSPLIAMSRLGRTSMATGQSRTLEWLMLHSDVPVWVVRR